MSDFWENLWNGGNSDDDTTSGNGANGVYDYEVDPQKIRSMGLRRAGKDAYGNRIWKDKAGHQYTAAHNFGNRMDCDFDTSYNLNGKVQGDTAIINFSSFYRAKNGKASLKITDGIMTWKILVWPKNGDCFAPGKASLTKKKW